MINKLKSQKGITGIDVTISLIIITLFVSIIVTLSMNVSASLASKKRIEIATNCMTEIMEKIDAIDYNAITISEAKDENIIENIIEKEDADAFESEIQNILKNEKYNILTVGIVKEKYIDETDGANTKDLIKKVTVKITYNKDEALEVTRLKTKYNVDLEKND